MTEEYSVSDLEDIVIKQFYEQNSPTHRYASFDYCFNYFQDSTHQSLEADIEKSCLHLSFYLASWGMLRGSSFLLQKSIQHYVPLINYIIDLKKQNHDIWHIDADNYSTKNINTLIEVYDNIKKILIGTEANQHLTLITKIMLGIFGNVPAFDQYFSNTFRILAIETNKCGFRSFNQRSLTNIRKFYEANKESINKLHNDINTIEFHTGKSSGNKYTIAKIIDMYGFAKSINNPI